MHKRPTVVHLVDDTTAGGVMRVLDHIKTSPDMARLAEHRFVTVRRGQVQYGRFNGAVIVSHLAISWHTLPALLGIRLANHGKKLVHVEHSYTEGFVHHNVPSIRRFNALLRIGFSFFDAIVAVSDAQADWFERLRFCSKDKLFAIRSCVDLSEFERLKPRRTPPKVIGAIGRLDRQKGFDVLIKGFRALPNEDISLHIYGTGEEFDQLKFLAGRDPRIQFKGFLDNPAHAYENVDVLVVPSRWEAYGLVAIEALCANRTVLCADVDGLRDHEEYGAHLFDGRTSDEVCRALARVLDGSQIIPRKCSPRTGEEAQQAFVTGWIRLMEKLMNARSISTMPTITAPS